MHQPLPWPLSIILLIWRKSHIYSIKERKRIKIETWNFICEAFVQNNHQSLFSQEYNKQLEFAGHENLGLWNPKKKSRTNDLMVRKVDCKMMSCG